MREEEKSFACSKKKTFFLCYTSTARSLWEIEREIKKAFRLFFSRGDGHLADKSLFS
jgi:hypothetical protein